MTLIQLKKVLEKEKISKYCYSILEKKYIYAPDGFIVELTDEGIYNLYYSERDKLKLVIASRDESVICKSFLQYMSNDYPCLDKYVQ